MKTNIVLLVRTSFVNDLKDRDRELFGFRIHAMSFLDSYFCVVLHFNDVILSSLEMLEIDWELVEE